jgi:hypothetical protein
MQASRFQKQEHVCLIQRRFGRKLTLHGRITFPTTAKKKKKLSYFLQDEFFAVEDAYNEATDLQEGINNFVETESFACVGGTDSTFRDETKSSSLKLPRSFFALPKFFDKFSEWKNFHHTVE